MSHYFDTPPGPATTHHVTYTVWDHDFDLLSAPGVFSAQRLDPGTATLCRLAAPPVDRPARLLDLGCGFGPLAIALATLCPLARVDAIDVNDRALDLTRTNADRLGLSGRVDAWRPEDTPADRRYDEIWSNPPIRIGKAALHALLESWLTRLTPEGTATLVVARNLGADSLASWLDDGGWVTSRLGSARGFRVFRVGRQPTNKR